MRAWAGAALLALAGPAFGEEEAASPQEPDACALIAVSADGAGLPRPFFARLIWKESRFDPQAVSPVGAEGIAQFMPATAKRRGLSNPFQPAEALPASAAYLAELREMFGSLGLAAAAYNAGETRVSQWLAGRSGLPAETRDYVFSITGKPADWFRETRQDAEVAPLDKELAFLDACRQMPVIATRADPRPPWGAVVAGGRNRRAAMAAFERVRRRAPSFIDAEKLFFVRKPRRAAGPVVTARIGAGSRNEALKICRRLTSAGIPCFVRRR